MRVSLFAYYGSLVSIDEVSSFMIPFGYNSIYDFIMSKNLNYKVVGNENSSRQVIIGEELLFEHDFNLFKLNLDEQVSVESKIGEIGLSLTNQQKNDVRNRLVQIGVREKPQYYIFASYEA